MRAGEVSEEDGSAIMNVEEVNPVPLADFGNLVDPDDITGAPARF